MVKIKKYLSEFLNKWGLRKWFQKDNLIILVLSGILLMIIAMPAGKQKAQENSETVKGEHSEMEGAADINWLGNGGEQNASSFHEEKDSAETGAPTQEGLDLERYVASLESRLTTLLSNMDGVGKVNVMITLQSSEELVLEKDMPIVRSNTTENDAEGGYRNISQVDSGEETVYSSDGSFKTPFVVKTLTPKIEGVVVMAQGAGTLRITADITEAVEALFGIDAHKVKVIRMKEEQE